MTVEATDNQSATLDLLNSVHADIKKESIRARKQSKSELDSELASIESDNLSTLFSGDAPKTFDMVDRVHATIKKAQATAKKQSKSELDKQITKIEQTHLKRLFDYMEVVKVRETETETE